MSELQTLGLNQPERYPSLGRVLDEKKLAQYLTDGLVQQVQHPDGETTLYAYTRKCLDEFWWDNVTMECRGLVVRGNKVIARPPRKFFYADTKAFPETIPSNWPQVEPEITKMLDGHQVVLYEGLKGPELASRDALANALTMWAGWFYRKYHKQAEWPKGYTPVFMALNSKFRKVMQYTTESLILTALVNNETGEEMPFDTMRAWGDENNVSTVFRYASTLKMLRTTTHPHRGWVLKWPREGAAPLRVGLPEKEYLRLRAIVSRVTPQGIWDLMRQGVDLRQLKDENLPREFVKWVEEWERRLRSRKYEVETEARSAFMLAHPAHEVDKAERKRLFEKFRTTVLPTRAHLMPLLVALMDEREMEPYSWLAAKSLTVGQKGWRNP